MPLRHGNFMPAADLSAGHPLNDRDVIIRGFNREALMRRLMSVMVVGAFLGPAMFARAAESDAATRPAWRDAFDRVYSLRDGEILKFVPGPFIPERMNYFKEVDKSESDAGFPFHVFVYDRGVLTRGAMVSGAGPAGVGVEEVIRNCAGLTTGRVTVDPALLNVGVSGDWIVREGAAPEEVLAALEGILAKNFGKAVKFEKYQEKKVVIGVTGKYAFRKLPEADRGDLQIFAEKLDHPKPGDRIAGGGTTSPAEFWGIMEQELGLAVVDEAKQEPPLIDWMISWSAMGADKDGDKRNLVMQNLAQQTGLTLKVENRVLDMWRVVKGK